MNSQELHASKVKEIASAYQQKGYSVVVEPEPSQVPSFLSGLQPDIIATTPEDSVVVEVKFRSALKSSDAARKMADLVGTQKVWRFELILLSEKEGLSTEIDPPLSIEQVKEFLVLATQEGSPVIDSMAFVTAWIASEALMRILAGKNLLEKETLSPGVLLKQLVFAGAISREQYQTLDEMLQLRNRVVHGFWPVNISRVNVRTLLKIAHELMVEIEDESPSK